MINAHQRSEMAERHRGTENYKKATSSGASHLNIKAKTPNLPDTEERSAGRPPLFASDFTIDYAGCRKIANYDAAMDEDTSNSFIRI